MKLIFKVSVVLALSLLSVILSQRDSTAYHLMTCSSDYIEGIEGHTLSGYNCMSFEDGTGFSWFNRSWGAWNPAGYIIIEEVEGYDRCESTDPWDLRINDSDYAFYTQVLWVDAYGTVQDCGQTQQHEYRSIGKHYWEDPSGDLLREVWTFVFLLGLLRLSPRCRCISPGSRAPV